MIHVCLVNLNKNYQKSCLFCAVTLNMVTQDRQEHNFPDHCQIPQLFKVFQDSGHSDQSIQVMN